MRHYWTKGWAATKFFFRLLAGAVRHAPRFTGPMAIFLGMYAHFCEVHGQQIAWDPWAAADDVPEPSLDPEARRRLFSFYRNSWTALVPGGIIAARLRLRAGRTGRTINLKL